MSDAEFPFLPNLWSPLLSDSIAHLHSPSTVMQQDTHTSTFHISKPVKLEVPLINITRQDKSLPCHKHDGSFLMWDLEMAENWDPDSSARALCSMYRQGIETCMYSFSCFRYSREGLKALPVILLFRSHCVHFFTSCNRDTTGSQRKSPLVPKTSVFIGRLALSYFYRIYLYAE